MGYKSIFSQWLVGWVGLGDGFWLKMEGAERYAYNREVWGGTGLRGVKSDGFSIHMRREAFWLTYGGHAYMFQWLCFLSFKYFLGVSISTIFRRGCRRSLSHSCSWMAKIKNTLAFDLIEVAAAASKKKIVNNWLGIYLWISVWLTPTFAFKSKSKYFKILSKN